MLPKVSNHRLSSLVVLGVCLPLMVCVAQVGETNLVYSMASRTNAFSLAGSELPGVEVSLLRLIGGLGFVVGLFLLGAWGFRHWQRSSFLQGKKPMLHVLEVRSIGNRQTLVVVGYQDRKLLIASGPAGSRLISHLNEPFELNLDEETQAEASTMPIH